MWCDPRSLIRIANKYVYIVFCFDFIFKIVGLFYLIVKSMVNIFYDNMYRRLYTTLVAQQISPSSTSISMSEILLNTPKIAKTFSTPGLQSLEWLYSVTPCFPLNGDQIQLIKEPGAFYETLVEKSANARKRIILASLYLGTGQLETKFVQTIQDNLDQNKQLKVNVLLDYTRGTRGEKSSKTMLMPLIQKFKDNFNLSMYHTPDLRGLTKRLAPPRWNELLGLQHMKVYLFDDSVMISGANLSNDYFTNRQDRYILIEDKSLADFYANFIEKVQEFSLSVKENSEIGLHKNWSILPYEGVKYDFINLAKQRIGKFFEDIYLQQKDALQTRSDADTWIFPLIEMGQLGIHHDSIVTKRLLSSSIDNSKLKLATGYFNLTEAYMETITNKCLANCSILMAHPNANGFMGAKGPAGSIPSAYSLIAKNFYDSLVNAQQDHRVKFFEYEKKGWSYHAKGLWYYLPNCNLPSLTLIGSSNFGERSVNRDLETQICVITTNKSLQNQLQAEVDNLYSQGAMAEEEISNRHVPRWVKAVVSVFRNFF